MKRSAPMKRGTFKRKPPALTERGRTILAGTAPKIPLDFQFDIATEPAVSLTPIDADTARFMLPGPRPRAKMAALLSTEAPVGVPKDDAFRSEAWLRAVRSIPCVFCGAPVQAAHRNEGKGMGLKTDDCLTAALCPPEHAEIDQGKGLSRDERRARMDRAIVLTLRELVRRGKVVLA